jgi:hypothetical protein
MGAQSISSRRANHPLNFTAAVLSSPRSSGPITPLIPALASGSSRLSLRSTRGTRASALTNRSIERSSGSHVMVRRRFRSSTEVRCGRERLRYAAGSWTCGRQLSTSAAAIRRCEISCVSRRSRPPTSTRSSLKRQKNVMVIGERPRPARGAKAPSASERGWGPASDEKSDEHPRTNDALGLELSCSAF